MTASMPVFDSAYAQLLAATKQAFVEPGSITQHGCSYIEPSSPWPGWPSGLVSAEPVIETFVVSPDGDVEATSDNEPFVSAWVPLVAWFAGEVRSALAATGVRLDGDGYATASLTDAVDLEGTAHMDDDVFVPTDNVGIVAIIGEHGGPRVAMTPLAHSPLRPMGQVVFDDATIDGFTTRTTAQAHANADQIAIFPQFGQLHAGPSAADIAHLAPTRQLLVFRARAAVSV